MEGKPSHVLLKKVKEVVNEYKSWGYGVGTIRSDSEAVYRSIKSDINFLGIRSEYAAPGVREKKAENTVKNLRDRFAVILNSLRFNLPANLYPRMLANIAATLNMIHTARSKPHTPVVIATGRKVSRKTDLKVPFGTCRARSVTREC
jgi:hypothetical protein